MDSATVLIISDDAEFTREVTARWQAERSVPAFTLMSGDVCLGTVPHTFEIAIVGGLRPGILPAVLATLAPSGKPILLLCENSQCADEVRETQPRAMIVRRHQDWLDALVMLASESLRRCEALARARRAEQANAALAAQATLGRYMLDMRHTVNNALTSILGNSELLLLEPGALSAAARSQIDTIRNMAVRMHEILQRFSSIEKELTVVDKQAQREVWTKSQSAASL